MANRKQKSDNLFPELTELTPFGKAVEQMNKQWHKGIRDAFKGFDDLAIKLPPLSFQPLAKK